MPLVQISLVRGREKETVQECVREVARTIARTLDAPLSSVRVIVTEVEPDHWAVGDRFTDET
ncbi:tautomerase family protein [Georgenia sp. SYP-B2076]|uniref:tautomerase family protein n=1 Tax=Georgenia sp. SYP-B2076 TaxID=2495881 RepID=UPI000F8C578B|nr:tautomerase family protein [Georgenia sp. SYP-B2076]